MKTYHRKPGIREWRLIYNAARRLGVTPEEVTKLREAKECAACQQPFGEGGLRQAIDHDHSTGRIRGVLHARCNTILGLAKDDPAVLESLVRFIS